MINSASWGSARGAISCAPHPSSLVAPSARPVSTLRPYLLPLALLGAPLAWGLLGAARRRFGLSPARLGMLLAVTILPVAVIFGFGFLRHVRILGRHLTPLFPFILVAQACALLFLWNGGRTLRRAAAVLLVAALALSSIEIRFAFRHSKDDYRAAAFAARQALARGDTVWWAASNDGARFYNLPFAARETPGAALWTYCVPARFTAPPDEIVLSKSDIFDPGGTLSEFIAAHHYHIDATFQAFTIWKL
jgi:hypothetical protein